MGCCATNTAEDTDCEDDSYTHPFIENPNQKQTINTVTSQISHIIKANEKGLSVFLYYLTIRKYKHCEITM